MASLLDKLKNDQQVSEQSGAFVVENNDMPQTEPRFENKYNLPYSDEDLKDLERLGYTQDRIKEMHDKASSGNYLDVFKSTTREPKPVDETAIKRAKSLASAHQGLSTLTQLIGATKGANIEKRNDSKPLDYVMSKEEQIRNLYNQNQSQYEAGLRNAMAQDWLRGISKAEKGIEGLDNKLAKQKAYQAELEKARREAQKNDLENQKWLAEYNRKLAKDKQDAIESEKDRQNRIKSAQLSKTKPSSKYKVWNDNQDGTVSITVTVPKGTKGSKALSTGESGIRYTIPEDEIPTYAMNARTAIRNNPEFKKKYQDVLTKTKTGTFGESEIAGWEDDETLAQAWAQFNAEKKYRPQPKATINWQMFPVQTNTKTPIKQIKF